MPLMVDQILAAAFRDSEIASVESLKKVTETKEGFKGLCLEKQKETADILGLANLALLDLEEAAHYFIESRNKERLRSVFELALRHGRYALVRFFLERGFQIGEEKDYVAFLKTKALPYLPLYRDKQEGFSIDERVLGMIIDDIKDPREKALSETVELMEKAGSRNLVKKFILAHYAKNPLLIQRYEGEFNGNASGGRERILEAMQEYCLSNGLGFVRALQEGDKDNYFPSVAHIFLVQDGRRKLVLKENLLLHQDYSRLDGYSMEKEILAVVRHKNIVRYLGSVDIKGIEFLALEFMPGITLERYVKPDNLLPLQKVIEIVITLAEVIDYLHQNKIISMDVKDKNVMYDGEKAALFDFGVSQITQNPFIASLLTTPEYTAPEMALSFRAYPQTDIFQLGILFYKLLVGKNPFVRYDLYDFAEDEGHRESCIIKFVLPMLFRPLDKSPKVLQENPAIAELLENMLDKDYQKRPEPGEIVEKLRGL